MSKQITEIVLNLNYVSYTANAQIIDSVNSQFFFLNRYDYWYIHFPYDMPTISFFF